MARRDIVVIGASAGGVEALVRLVSLLPDDLASSLFVVQHVAPGLRSYLPEVLNRAGSLPAAHAVESEPIRPGRIYIAPPDRHLLLSSDRVRVSIGPRENGVRPAVDPLFRSAARAFGPRVMAIVLSGALDDGSAGLFDVAQAGGLCVAQEPEEAGTPDMPRNAIAKDHVDEILRLEQIAELIIRSSRQKPVRRKRARNARRDKEVRAAILDFRQLQDDARPGAPSAFACPECNGVLWQIEDEGVLRFRCRVGHAYTAAALAAHQAANMEVALYTALRTLEEGATLARRLATKARGNAAPHTADRFERRTTSFEHQAALVRQAILHLANDAGPDAAAATMPRSRKRRPARKRLARKRGGG